MPEGTLQFGAFTVSERGLVTSTGARESSIECRQKAKGDGNGSTQDAIIANQPLRQQLIRTRRLGQGASAVVYEALHAPSLTLVAEKVMPGT
jgi:hypothetical protein